MSGWLSMWLEISPAIAVVARHCDCCRTEQHEPVQAEQQISALAEMARERGSGSPSMNRATIDEPSPKAAPRKTCKTHGWVTSSKPFISDLTSVPTIMPRARWMNATITVEATARTGSDRFGDSGARSRGRRARQLLRPVQASMLRRSNGHDRCGVSAGRRKQRDSRAHA